ncbi:MAG: prepilin peptidase [Acidaminococcaceae bacterium]|nr:prepilin peptidase [Acidaminococcaceae bacterium]
MKMLSYVLVLVFIFGLCIVAYVDLRRKIILDEVLILLLSAGLVYTGIFGNTWSESLLGAVTGSGLLGLLYLMSRGGMGLGDVKFAGVLGIWTGFPGIVVNLYLAFFLGGTVALLLCALHKANRKTRLPFGPCLCAGAVLSFFFSSRILDWYWSLIL